jgi:hypothetical protein
LRRAPPHRTAPSPKQGQGLCEGGEAVLVADRSLRSSAALEPPLPSIGRRRPTGRCRSMVCPAVVRFRCAQKLDLRPLLCRPLGSTPEAVYIPSAANNLVVDIDEAWSNELPRQPSHAPRRRAHIPLLRSQPVDLPV